MSNKQISSIEIVDESLDKIIDLPFKSGCEILSLGAEQKAAFCFCQDNHAFISKNLGDLENLESLRNFKEAIGNSKARFDIKPNILVCDLHPEYLSNKYAREFIAGTNAVKLIEVQHHHAHIASCMADNHLRNQKVIGVAFDGTGFGVDSRLWGGEFLVADYASFKRAAHFDYIGLSGGVAAIKEPWRIAAAYLYQVFGNDFLNIKIDFVRRLDKKNWQVLKTMIDKGINTPLSSSVGRLFDAVSSLIGVRDKASYEGEAAIELEKAIDEGNPAKSFYEYTIKNKDDVFVIDAGPLIKAIVDDLKKKVPQGLVSFKFHNSIVRIIVDTCKKIKDKSSIKTVALSGGVFLNKFISQKAIEGLSRAGFRVITHKRVSTGDAGICLGQLAVAAHRRIK